MRLDVYVKHCKKLIDKYGPYKANKQLLNDVWTKIKNEPDEFIIKRVNDLMSSKCTYSDLFTIDDFLPNINNLFHIKKPVNSKGFHKKRDIKRNNQSLKRVLDSMGASNIIDAMSKVKRSRM